MGAGSIIAAKSEAFTHYDAKGWASALDAVVPQGTLITGASPQSKDLAARLAARRGLSVVQDAVAIDGHISPMGVLARLETDSQVHFLTAIGGG